MELLLLSLQETQWFLQVSLGVAKNKWSLYDHAGKEVERRRRQ
jgi:hypothetical protein